ncbi:MsnO8 family LLM class oxidoreductase [Kribbella kalugense]|uniref:Luciferase family oxidoreductase group 1 n=1 Tax=Kribbella kalugense TaxID=2512221 RepID=A0A4R7ZII9_9ACTN|nr:MsnO8 family LLM class oxidoreductase [Kribbella kalugense]TDW17529.1 luciferase family oxidoreductase group 1 [Kribbella kalugense]
MHTPLAPGLPVSAHSVLDVVPQLPGQSAAAALRETAEVALTADDLGYRRFWLAEQHGVRGVGGAAPAVLTAILASRTDRIRLGAGGLLLTNHQPLVVAEQFAALAAAYPSRIDLGVGEQRTVAPSTAAALAGGARGSFPQRLDELCGFLRDGTPGRAQVGDVRLSLAGLPPPVFVLADHPGAAVTAAVRGLPVFLSHHCAASVTPAAVAAYRDHFEPTGPKVQPYVAVTVGVVAADSEEEAVVRFAEYVRVKTRLAAAGPRMTSAELMALLEQPITGRERGRAERLLDDPGHVVGSRATVAAELGALVASTTADEVMLVPLAFDGIIRSAILRTVAAGLTRVVRTVPRHTSPLIATA